MKVLIKYIDFHWDNYQGGSGKTIESTLIVDVLESLTVRDVYNYLHNSLLGHVILKRPFKQDNKHTVVSMELL